MAYLETLATRSYSDNFTPLLLHSKSYNCWLGVNCVRAKRQSAEVKASQFWFWCFWFFGFFFL